MSSAPAIDDEEELITRVIDHLRSTLPAGQNPKYTAVARKWGIRSAQKLRRRWLGIHETPSQSHTKQQHLTPTQELVLAEWCDWHASMGSPLRRSQIKGRVNVIRGAFGLPAVIVGRKWVSKFLRRHRAIIKCGRTQSLDPKRAQAFNKPSIDSHFDLLESLMRHYDIPPENLYNMDEKGCQRGGGRSQTRVKYIISRRSRTAYKKRSPNLELVTIVEAVAADGGSIKPGFIFEGKQSCKEWFEVDNDISIGVSPNGWTDDFLGNEWFEKTFVPQAKARNSSGKDILLILDGHGSHQTLKFRETACAHRIHLLCLPPHTTHKLQPLDVGVFGPFAAGWRTQCEEYMDKIDAEMPKSAFVKEYMAVREKFFTPHIIQKAFEKTGIYPLDRNVFTEDDFAPSVESSVFGHLPPSFPHATALGLPEDPDLGSLQSDASSESDDTHSHASDDDPTSRSRDLDMDDRVSHRSIPSSSPILPDSSPSQDTSPSSPPSNPSSLDGTLHANAEPGLEPSESLHNRVTVLEARLSRAENRLESALSHNSLCKQRIDILHRKLNTKRTERASRANVVSDSRWLTSAQGLAHAEAQEQARLEKDQAKQRKQAEKERLAKERAAARAVRDPDFQFTGPLSSQQKDVLEDISAGMGLSIPSKATVVALRNLISDHVASNPSLRDDPRYRQLFVSRLRGSRATGIENDSNSVRYAPYPESSWSQRLHTPQQTVSASTSGIGFGPPLSPRRPLTHHNPVQRQYPPHWTHPSFSIHPRAPHFHSPPRGAANGTHSPYPPNYTPFSYTS